MSKSKIETVDVAPESKSGHRERLRARFVAGVENARSEEALLELLLTYAIPQKDVQPLARELITTFGSLANVLSTDLATLCKQDGIKEYAAILMKLVDLIRTSAVREEVTHIHPHDITTQPTLFPEISSGEVPSHTSSRTKLKQASTSTQNRSGLFSHALLKEAIVMLPQLPDTESLAEIRSFLVAHLHFSAQTTRVRNAEYIVQRMFPAGYADQALRTFAQKYAGKQELRDVCLYRFCKAEPLLLEIVEQLVLPATGAGQLERSHLRNYLVRRFPTYASANRCSRAVVEAFVESGLATADRLILYLSYRDISLPAFAFMIHSDFPEPGMFDIGKIEHNRAMRVMLWKPDAILPALYELRNKAILSKISEIDSVRQFTTKYTLDQLCKVL